MRHQIVAHEEWITARREQWDNGRRAEMIGSAPDLIDSNVASLRKRPNASADCLLSLAAALTFAIMALLTGIHGGSMPDMLCSAGGNGLPLSGMFLMYLLMSAFHLGPWLKLISCRRSRARRSSQMGLYDWS